MGTAGARVIAAAFALLGAASGWGATYRVSPAGSDAGPGSTARPWKTLGRAAAMSGPGDTVVIAPGTYRERLVPQRSGSEGRPVTWAAEGPGVTIDGTGIELPDDLAGLVELAGRSWITLEGLRVINAGPYRDNAGILVLDSADVVVRSCSTAVTTSSGIGVWNSARVTVADCTVERAGSGGYQECISVAGTDTFTVSGCTVTDGRKEGICVKDGSSHGVVRGNDVTRAYSEGIYVDAWDKHTHDIEVVGNRAHGNDGNGIALASEQGGLLENVSIHDNLCWRNRFLGIHVSTNGDSAAHPMRGVRILNNTCASNGWQDWGGGIALDNPDARAVTIRNNICSANRYFQLLVVETARRADVAVDHNLIGGFAGTEGEILGDAAVQGDPLFVDAGRADFRLRKGSPAIGTGTTAGAAARDFAGRARPLAGAACDIGAHVF